jgi:hypothetical protein
MGDVQLPDPFWFTASSSSCPESVDGCVSSLIDSALK